MRGSTWLAISQVGASLARVAAGEWQTMKAEMRRSARLSAGAVLTLAVGLGFLTVALVGVLFGVAAVLSRWMPHWAGLLLMSGVFGVVAAFLLWRARHMLRQVESPQQLVRRRWKDHRKSLRRQPGTGSEESDRG